MGSEPRWRPKLCVECGEPASELEPLSIRGLHESCAIKRMHKAAGQLAAKKGPYYDQWRKSYLAAAERIAASG